MTQDEISQVHPFIRGLKMTKSPCANDVALLGYIMNDNHNGKFRVLFNVGSSDLCIQQMSS